MGRPLAPVNAWAVGLLVPEYLTVKLVGEQINGGIQVRMIGLAVNVFTG